MLQFLPITGYLPSPTHNLLTPSAIPPQSAVRIKKTQKYVIFFSFVKSYSHIRFCCPGTVPGENNFRSIPLTLHPMDTKSRAAYWKKNIRILFILLTVWFIVSFGCGILLVDQLNQIRLGGFKLGFWFAQQGAIYFFVILIFVYVVRMNMLDKEFNVNEE